MKSFRKNIKGNSILNLQGFKKIIPSFLILNFSFLINIQAQNSLDQLQYNYYSNTNRLEYLTDAVSSVTARIDIDNQSTGNYSYDAIGQLTQDISEGILDIDWTVSGKVKKVSIDDDGNSVADRTLEFKYDALGNRVKKIETTIATSATQTTIYIRNATGDLISIYESDGTTTERTEVCISGVGTDKAAETSASAEIKERNLGNKSYELKDHLGNVRVTVSDVKEPSNLSILNSTDYYAFGMQMPGRTMSLVEGRYGFQGKEKDDELKGNGNSYDFGARLYDPRVGKWLSRDPLEAKYPDLSPYNFCVNNPIMFVDPDGKQAVAVFNTEEKVFERRAKKHITEKGGGSVVAGNDNLITNLKDISDENPISSLIIYTHSTEFGLYFGESQLFSRAKNDMDAGDMEKIKFTPNAYIIIAGCNTAQTKYIDGYNLAAFKNVPLAYEIAKSTGVGVFASAGEVSPQNVDGRETGQLLSFDNNNGGLPIPKENIGWRYIRYDKEIDHYWVLKMGQPVKGGVLLDPNNPYKLQSAYIGEKTMNENWEHQKNEYEQEREARSAESSTIPDKE